MYKDVPRNSKFYDAIEFLQCAGIMIGDENENFNPTASVSWGDVFVLLYNYSSLRDNSSLEFEYDCIFNKQFDEENPGFLWAKPYVYYFVKIDLAPNKQLWSKKLDQQITLNAFINFLKTLDPELSDLSDDLPDFFDQEKPTRENIAFILYTGFKLKANHIQDTIETALKNGEYSSALYEIHKSTLYFSCFHPDLAKISNLVSKQTGYSEIHIQFIYKLLLFKQSLQLNKQSASPIYHYTSLLTLEKLSAGSKFRAYHTEYLNDPNEGKRILSLLKDYKLDQRYLGWNPLLTSSSGVFLVSFISAPKDNLPMWSQYGNQYAGCCLEFIPSKIPYELYNIIYEEATFKKVLESFFQILDDYKKFLKNEKILININSDPVFLFAQNILQFIRYLYKNQAFENEREVRLLIFDDLSSAYTEDNVRPGESFPRIFKEIELPRLNEKISNSPMSIENIYLGPKAYKPNWVKISLIQRGYSEHRIHKSAVELQ